MIGAQNSDDNLGRCTPPASHLPVVNNLIMCTEFMYDM